MNQVFTPLVFYTDILLQNRFKKQCLKDCRNPLISPNNRFLNFQFRRETSSNPVTKFELYDLNDLLVLTIPTYYVRSFSSAEFDYFMYFGDNLLMELPCGEYYLKITTVSEEYFSEVFEVKKFEQYFEPGAFGIINNGNFETNDYWGRSFNNPTEGWHIANNKATCDAGGFNQTMRYSWFNLGTNNIFPVQTGKKLKVKFTLSDYAGGTLTIMADLINTSHGVTFNANGTYEFELTVYDHWFTFYPSTTFKGSVSKVSIYVLENYKNCDKIYLKWKNSCDLYNIKFSNFPNINANIQENYLIYNGYANEIFLETQIGEPEYRSFAEVSEDGAFNKIATFSKDNKWYKLNTLLVAEFLVDAFSIIPRFETITIYDPYKDELHVVEEIEFTPEWFSDACFALIQITWKTFDLIADACCDLITPTPCLECSGEFATIWIDHDLPDTGDFEEGDIILVPGNQPIENYWYAATEIYMLVDGEWVEQTQPALYTLFCFGNQQFIYKGDNEWIAFPFIWLSDLDNCSALIKAFLVPGMVAELFIDLNGGGYVSQGIFSAEEFLAGVPFIATEETSYEYKVKINVFTLNCKYGYSPEMHIFGGGANINAVTSETENYMQQGVTEGWNANFVIAPIYPFTPGQIVDIVHNGLVYGTGEVQSLGGSLLNINWITCVGGTGINYSSWTIGLVGAPHCGIVSTSY